MQGQDIVRVPGRTDEEVRSHLSRGEPVIFTALTEHWPARELWSLSYFRSRAADANVLVAHTPGGRLPVGGGKAIPQQQMRFGEFLDGLQSGRRDRYLITPIWQMLPQLMGDVRLPAVYAQAAFTDARFWVGPADFCTPLHHDLPENLFAQIVGRKRVVLIPRWQRRAVYPFGPFSGTPNFAQVDAERPDLARFPAFARATRLSCVVEPGEVLYIPRRWWHQLQSLDVSASVNLWFAEGLTALLSRGAQAYARLRRLRAA
jgi:hypothetical protein